MEYVNIDNMSKYKALYMVTGSVFILLVLSSIYYCKTRSASCILPAINVSDSVPSSYVIEQKKKENKYETNVSEKINGQELPTVIIKSEQPISHIETIPREYKLSVEQSQEGSESFVKPVLTIVSADGKQVSVEGQKLLIEPVKSSNGIVFKPFIGASIEYPVQAGINIGINLLRYNKLKFLSPSISLSTNKEKELLYKVSIEPIKYNLYSNSSIGLSLSLNNKLSYSGGIIVSVEL